MEVRAILAITLVLAACGGHDASPSATNDVEPAERCDPATPRVCVANDVVACEPGGKLGRRLRTCKDGCADGRCKGQCTTSGAELVYAVDEDDNFLSFDPRKLPGDPFTVIGRLTCTDRGTPFSMAVDRDGSAWVLYSDQEVYEVSITDATCKKKPAYYSSIGVFGMGYAMDPSGTTETLYVSPRSSGKLARFDRKVTHADVVGQLTAYDGANPELTGTRDGRLYGFYPSISGPPFVQEIDKQTAEAKGPRWTLGSDPMDITAYAFAQWGGVFYVFVSNFDGSAVWAVDKSGTYRIARDHVPYRITGAGVSTCAPERDGVSLGHP